MNWSCLLLELEEKSEHYDIAIVIPTLNEELGIDSTISSIKKALQGKFSYTIIVVDGLSTDKTVEIAKANNAKVILQRRRGYGDALQAGFHYVDTKLDTTITVMLDADGTYEPKDIEKMADIILKGAADFVIGNRFANMAPKAMSRTNKIGNKVISALSRNFLKLNVTDSQCGLRAFRSDLAKIFFTSSHGMPFATEMLASAKEHNISVKEIPTSYYPRLGEAKLNSFHDGSRILGTIIRLLRDTRPLPLFGSIGLLLFAIGTFFGSGVLIEYWQTGTVTRIPTAVLSILFIFLSAQSFSLGLISDMLKNRSIERRIFYNEI